jgi:two-component system, OmpR family, response regulator VicR
MTTVLIVDDEVTLREMITMVLEDAGFTALTASNGAEALEVLAREGADVVLMDIMMPVLDGREAFRRIRADPDLRHVPVVLMSAADPPPLDKAVSGFLSKPFRLIELLEVVLAVAAPV